MSPSTAGVNSFKLHDRAKHVYSEAARVLKFKNVCEEKPANAVQVGKLHNLLKIFKKQFVCVLRAVALALHLLSSLIS